MEVEQVEISELKPNTKNPRRITRAELNKLIRSIKEFGFVDPVIVNKHKNRYNIIIGGHQRVEAAKKMKLRTVPVTYVDLPESKEHLLNIALNEISGEWDDTKLYLLLKELQEKDIDLTLTGFDEALIDEIMSANKEQERDSLIDVVPTSPEKPKTKIGEVWILGKHRLMCGDSTKSEDFNKLMGQEKADLCWTDPPYGVSYKGTNNPNGRPWGVMKNDELRGDDLFKLLEPAYQNIWDFTKKGAPLYSCYASVNHIIFETALNKAGWIVKQQIIWEKGHVLGRSDYHWSHEPILYCRRGEDNTPWYGDRTHKTTILRSTIEQLNDLKKEDLIRIISQVRENSDMLSIKKDPTAEYLHATQKPVNLSKTHIKNSSRPKDIVLEPFAGSGSTLMACEVSSRCCRAMELDPKNVDVILTRWANYTEKDPIREGDGAKWNKLKIQK